MLTIAVHHSHHDYPMALSNKVKIITAKKETGTPICMDLYILTICAPVPFDPVDTASRSVNSSHNRPLC